MVGGGTHPNVAAASAAPDAQWREAKMQNDIRPRAARERIIIFAIFYATAFVAFLLLFLSWSVASYDELRHWE